MKWIRYYTWDNQPLVDSFKLRTTFLLFISYYSWIPMNSTDPGHHFTMYIKHEWPTLHLLIWNF